MLNRPCITRAITRTALAAAVLVLWPTPARADLTAFLGITPTPENRLTRGFAGGAGLLIIGFEFEYANTTEDELDGVPGLRTWSGNLLLQTPLDVGGVQLYGTTGFGLYRETLLNERETSAAVNLGGGAKIRLVGPLRLRLDYRVFKLQGDPLYQTYHRVYAGANLRF